MAIERDLIEASENLSDDEFKKWYVQKIRDKGNMYWNSDCKCDRCHKEISDISQLRIMFGRRIHPGCFKLDYQDWLKKSEEDNYIDEDARKYFERVIKVLC